MDASTLREAWKLPDYVALRLLRQFEVLILKKDLIARDGQRLKEKIGSSLAYQVSLLAFEELSGLQFEVGRVLLFHFIYVEYEGSLLEILPERSLLRLGKALVDFRSFG